MTEIDIITAALCAWKEGRGGGVDSMRAVINVLLNRAKANGDSVYAEAYKPWQFSSMTAPHDPQLLLQPEESHAADWTQWLNAKSLALSASSGAFEDNTGGAIFYYAETMDNHPPGWAALMIPTVVIGGQRFFKKRA